MSELGEKLRQAREEQGLSLADVEERTHIRREFLEALENGDYARLPEPVYVRGFVRGYAGALGLEPAPLLALVHIKGDDRRRLPQFVLDRPLQQPPSRPKALYRGLLGLLGALAVAAIAWWFISTYYLRIDPLAPLGDVPWQRTRTPAATIPAHTVTPQAADPTDTPPALLGTARESTPTPTLTPTPSPTAVNTKRPTALPTSTPTASPSAGVEVRMRVDAVTWIRVTVDDQAPVDALLEIGDDQIWRGNESIALVIGNAAGAYLTVNGEELGHLGDEGEVVRITFGPGSLP
ncbi:MAG: helix-turn-helix domain-containing protein [Anaerolineae bacterium]|nr:helix-turn-helix domain-containing protein [Anaerolineae bacterium]